MVVPLTVLISVSLVDHTDVILCPGEAMSKQLLKLLNEARASILVLAETVMAARRWTASSCKRHRRFFQLHHSCYPSAHKHLNNGVQRQRNPFTQTY